MKDNLVYQTLVKKFNQNGTFKEYIEKVELTKKIKTYSLILIILFSIITAYLIPIANLGNTKDIIILIIQIETAIIAIILSLFFVAVQIADQSYSTRVISIFKEDISLPMLLLYIISIISGLIILILSNAGILRGNLLLYTTKFAYIFSIIAIIALVPYVMLSFDLMKRTKLIDNLSKKISGKSFIEFIDKNESGLNAEIPIQPLMDIINFSLAKDDSYTVIYGLQTIKEHFIPIIENNDIEIKKRRIIMFKKIVFDLCLPIGSFLNSLTMILYFPL